jgi:hypothetical protein
MRQIGQDWTIIIAALVLQAPGVGAEAAQYSRFLDLIVSDSPEGSQSTGDAHPGLDTLFVHVTSTETTLEIQFAMTGTYEIVELTPAAGLELRGPPESLSLVPQPGGVIPSFGVLVTAIVRDQGGTGAELCLGESLETGRLCFGGGDRWVRVTYWNGYATTGSFPCWGAGSEGCATLAVESLSWGRLKALYGRPSN